MVKKEPLLIGWREWAGLPDLKIPLIKVKIDTGARTSVLHADNIEIVQVEGKQFAKFIIHPIQKNDQISIQTMAEIVDMRVVKSSNGHKQLRVVVNSTIQIGDYKANINITLTNRDIMNHRMLLGRSAMKNILINPSKSYYLGQVSKAQALDTYRHIWHC